MRPFRAPSKYRNRKTVVDGITFDSKGEYAKWQELQLMEKAGLITNLQRQVTFVLAPSVVLDGRKRPEMRFTADFQFLDSDGQLVVADFKNPTTANETAFKMRRHLMRSVHGIEVRVYTRSK